MPPDSPPACDWRPILEIIDVSKRFGPTVVAAGLSLSIERGEFFTFLGPSGSGKSTILRMVGGLERPDEGQIRLDGRNMSGVPPWRRNLGMMFQQYAVFPHMTVAENVAYGLRVRGIGRSAIDARVAAMLDLVGLAGMASKNATLLSGGEQQRVALARALAPEPRLLLMDEPLSALDEKIRRAMQTELKDVHRKTGTTFVYVTHDQEEALTMSDRIAVFNHGLCVQCDTPEQLYRRPRTRFVAEFFRGCNVLVARPLDGSGEGLSVSVAGAEVRLMPPGANGQQAGAPVHLAVRAENVHLDALDDPRCLRVPVRLLGHTFRGAVFEHALELADGQRLIATAAQHAQAGDGSLTVAQIAPEDLVLLAD